MTHEIKLSNEIKAFKWEDGAMTFQPYRQREFSLSADEVKKLAAYFNELPQMRDCIYKPGRGGE